MRNNEEKVMKMEILMLGLMVLPFVIIALMVMMPMPKGL